MITLFIGQSGAGKTTYVRRHYVMGRSGLVLDYQPPNLPKIQYTYIDGLVFVGKYDPRFDRCQGTDTLDYQAVPSILRLCDKYYPTHNIIMEGDRITRAQVFDYLIARHYYCKLYLVVCPLDESMMRLRRAGSKITDAWVKSTRTKSQRIFDAYKDAMNGEIIDTGKEEP